MSKNKLVLRAGFRPLHGWGGRDPQLHEGANFLFL